MTHNATSESTVDKERDLRERLRDRPDLLDYVFGLDSIAQQALAAAAGRGAGAAVRNAAESRALRDKVAKAARLVSLHDLPERKRVDAVRKVFRRFGPEHFGLKSTPDKETIGLVIDEILEKPAIPVPASRIS